MRCEEIIMVQNIPADWTDVDVQQICSKYGQLENFIRFCDCKTFALVAFKTKSAAQEAVVKIPADTSVGMEAYICDGNTPSSKNRVEFFPTQSNDAARANGICTKCKNKGIFACERCGDPYCSVECQQQDWRRHKKLCIPFMHHFPHINFSYQRYHINGRRIPNETVVQITQILEPNCMYVQPADRAHHKRYLFLSIALNEYGKEHFKPLKTLPIKNRIFLAQIDDSYHRVIILNLMTESLKTEVLCVDLGETRLVWFCQMSDLTGYLEEYPVVIDKIHLSGVSNGADDDSAPVEFLREVQSRKVPLKLLYDNFGRKLCCLQFIDEPLTVNRKMIYLDLVRKGKINFEPDTVNNEFFTNRMPVFDFDIPRLRLDGFDINMAVLSNGNYDTLEKFTGIAEAKYDAYMRNMSAIEDYGQRCERKMSPQMPRFHEVYLVRSASRRRWCRAFCADFNSVSKFALMVHLDSDEVEDVRRRHIFYLPPTLSFPVISDTFIAKRKESSESAPGTQYSAGSILRIRRLKQKSNGTMLAYI